MTYDEKAEKLMVLAFGAGISANQSQALIAAELRKWDAESVQLLKGANKWVRKVEERRGEIPHWFRHDADPTPLRRHIETFIRQFDP